MKAAYILCFLLSLGMIVGGLDRNTHEFSAEQHARLVENNRRFAAALAACLNGGTLIESGRVIECKPKKGKTAL